MKIHKHRKLFKDDFDIYSIDDFELIFEDEIFDYLVRTVKQDRERFKSLPEFDENKITLEEQFRCFLNSVICQYAREKLREEK